jgi:hypothetical protein
MVSRYGDPILFVKDYGANKVHISGAERSCGLRWTAGEFTGEEARELWDTVIGEGGRMADPSIVAKFSTMLDGLTYDLDMCRRTSRNLSDELNSCRERLDKIHAEFDDSVAAEVERKVNATINTLFGGMEKGYAKDGIDPLELP